MKTVAVLVLGIVIGFGLAVAVGYFAPDTLEHILNGG